MQVFFCTKPMNIISFLIRLVTWSKYSHCVIIEDDEWVIDSTFSHGGVCRRSRKDVEIEYPVKKYAEYTVPDEKAAMDFVRSQIGKPYDKGVFLSVLLHRNWESSSAWFCNELLEAAIIAGGRIRFRDGLNRITPDISYNTI